MHHFLALTASAPQPNLIAQPLLNMIGHLFPMFLVLGLLVIVVKVLKRPSVKGLIGETAVNWGGLSRLDKASYSVLKNVFIPSISGKGMTEIDHVVVSAHGIFVIETKNFDRCWIFGNESDQTWTRSNYGKKHRFLNPLQQNKLHVDSLAAFLDLPRSVFHSVVFFIGDAEIKTPMPPNVLTSGLAGYIESKQDCLLSLSQVLAAWESLSEHDAGMDKRAVRREHVGRLSARVHG